MIDQIDSEDWKILKEQTKRYEELEKEFLASSVPPKSEDAERWYREQEKILEIIQDIRHKRNICTYILFHDETIPFGDLSDWTEALPHQLKKGLYEKIAITMNRLKRDIQRVLWILHEMEFWAPERELQLQPINIPRLMAQIQPWLESQLKKFNRSKNILIKIEVEEEFSGLVHEPIIAMLLLNMATNAGMHGKSDTIEIVIKKKDGNGVIEIRDNGNGIDSERMPTVFVWNPEKRGEKAGIGLGRAQEKMAIMNGTINGEAHGGLPNKSGSHGAKFTITFPLQN